MNTKALRQKILDLAIRGKLVPQDPNDEPASVLLQRIRAEKERLIKEGKIKRPPVCRQARKKSASSDTPHYENVPFEVPSSWEWCKLEDIAYVASGSTPSKSCFVEKGIPYLKMYNLRNQKIDFDFHPQYINEETHKGKLARSIATSGDLMMNIVGPPLGKLAIIPDSIKECNFNQAAVMISPYLYKDIVNGYLYHYLSEMSEINSIITKGSAGQVNISLTQSQNMRIPFPPLTEQKRIIAEIERWFALIDEIEKGQTDLATLIEQTKSKVLDLAIHGKLVPQDPADEPAIDLLRRINPDFQPCDTSQYEQLPQGWCVTQLGDVATFERGITFPAIAKSRIKEDGMIACLRTANVHEELVLDDLLYIDENYIKGNSTKEVRINDIIISTANSREMVGRSCLVRYRPQERMTFGGFVTTVRLNECCHPAFAIQILHSLFRSGKFMEICTQTTNLANIKTSELSELQILLPPKHEQETIVSKVGEIFKQIDSISQTLTD